MIDSADKQTVDLFQPAKRGRGRPSTGNAASAAERAKRYRANKKAARSLMGVVTSDINMTENVTENNENVEFWRERALARGVQVGAMSAQIEQLRECLSDVIEGYGARMSQADLNRYQAVLNP